MNTRTLSRGWLVGLCLLFSVSLLAQAPEWKVASFGIHLQYDTPTEPKADSAFVQAHLLNPRPIDSEVRLDPRRAFDMKRHFQSGVNLSLEKQLEENNFAQLRLNLNYSSPHGRNLQFDENSSARISQQGIGLNIDYRRVWKKGAVSISTGIGVGGKWYINPNITFTTVRDSTSSGNFNTPGGAGGRTFTIRMIEMERETNLRHRVDFNLYLPIGIAVRLTRRIQIEFDARLGAGTQYINQIGRFKRPLGGNFQLAYVFLL